MPGAVLASADSMVVQDDPMVVMRRIVNEQWSIKYPSYLSASAKVGLPDSSLRLVRGHLQDLAL